MRIGAVAVVLLTGLLTAAGGGPATASPAFDVESARIPATCGHPPARLHGGHKDFGTRADGSHRGDASLVSRSHPTSIPVRDPIVGRQRGTSAHGSSEVAPIVCSAGGVDHPETLVLWDRSGRILASTYLGRIAKQEHASVTAVRLRGNHLRAHWDAYDGAGFDVHHQSATFTLRGGKLVASGIDRG